MNSFKFQTQEEEELKIERIIAERKHKIAVQQIVYSSILALILLGAAIYAYNKLHYEEFDGYVSTEHWMKRAITDLYVDKCYVKTGDIVLPGDTLYSYVILDNILKLNDISKAPSIIAQDRTIRLQSGVNMPDINLLTTRIKELKKQIALEDNNIKFGMSDNSHKMDLERQLAETQSELETARQKVNAYNEMKRETSDEISKSLYAKSVPNGNDFNLNRYLQAHPEAIGYNISDDTLVISQCCVTDKSFALKGESLLLTQRLNLARANVTIQTYVPTSKIKHVNNFTKAEIIVNDDIRFNARVHLLGARTEELPKELRNSLSRDYRAVIVEFKPEAGQEMPFWSVVNGIPVTVRIDKFKNYSDGNKYHDYWYLGGDGFITESLKHLLKKK